jgi:hypothetical protein
VTENDRSTTDQKQGVINKCPNCGGALKAFASRCELCGHELSGVSASKTVTDLVQKFNGIEAALDAAGLHGNKRIKELVSRKGQVIRDFPIPNSREDLQSLIYFIRPKIQDDIKPDPNAEDWRVKFQEVFNLAKNAYKGDAKMRAEFEEIERSLNVSVSGVLKSRAKRFPLVAAGVVVVAILCVIGFASTQVDDWKLKQCEEKYAKGASAEKARLETISATVTAKLQAEDYAAAQAGLNGLRWEYQETCKSDGALKEKAAWEAQRQELQGRIQNAENAVVVKQREAVQREADQQRAEAEREAAQKQAEVGREAAQKRAAADRAEARRVAEAENDLSNKIRQRSASRKATGE